MNSMRQRGTLTLDGSVHYSFEVAAGSVQGREHRRLGRNNQDAYYFEWSDQGLVAAVCDGCGSESHSEVGAQLGAILFVKTVLNLMAYHQSLHWETIHNELLRSFQNVVEHWEPDIIAEYCLFTIIGSIITPESVILISLGDGLIVVNGTIKIIGPYANNAPPYLGHSLISEHSISPIQIQAKCSTQNLGSLLIGTDGVEDLIRVEHDPLPGRSQLVGPLSQFWTDNGYFKNSDQIRRKLTLINRDSIQADWANQRLHHTAGLLPDDTTFIVIRRITEA